MNNECLYIYKKETMTTYLLLYVDDLIITSNNFEFLKIVKEKLIKNLR